MSGKEGPSEGTPSENLEVARMSRTELYHIMAEMKALTDQNPQQVRQILAQNPALARSLFQAQIMLGMLQPPDEPHQQFHEAQPSQPMPQPHQHLQPMQPMPPQPHTEPEPKKPNAKPW
ncbi:hypothetical protein AAG906_013967 [Vitis piasezkii]